MSMSKLAWPVTVFSVILLVAVLLYAFGTPTQGASEGGAPVGVDARPSEAVAEVEPGVPTNAAPPMGQVVDGEAPAPDPSSPLAIEIPGCMCHSDDPDVVAEHEQYRMNQCAGCHMGGTPGG